MYQGKLEVTGRWNRSGSNEGYGSILHYNALFTCEQASSTVQVVGRFLNLHNPQKMHMLQISYKKYIYTWFSGRLFTLTQTW